MVRVSCAQIAPVIGDLAGNLELTSDAIAEAVADGADVVVLPELALTGYMFADAAEATSVALTPADPVFDRWAAVAGGSVVVGGYCEAGDDGTLFNSAVMVDRDGVITSYRKTHLWDTEKLLFSAGDVMPAVLDTRHGRLSLMICYDLEFPEVSRAVALRGAELVVAPVNWPRFATPEGERPGEVISAMAAARTNRIAIAVCDRAGTERGQAWTEGSVVIGPDGYVLAQAGSGLTTISAEIDLSVTHDKRLTELVDVLADRRTDLY